MAIKANKYKLGELAKDLELTNNDVISCLAQLSEDAKKSQSALTPEEISYVLEYFTQQNQVENFNAFYADNQKPEDKKKVRFYAGFNYVKLRKDTNGNKFNKENLLVYAEKCHYMVTVMRELGDEIVLYSYDVPNAELFKFMKSFEENTLDGTIIEIEKYFPEDLA